MAENMAPSRIMGCTVPTVRELIYFFGMISMGLVEMFIIYPVAFLGVIYGYVEKCYNWIWNNFAKPMVNPAVNTITKLYLATEMFALGVEYTVINVCMIPLRAAYNFANAVRERHATLGCALLWIVWRTSEFLFLTVKFYFLPLLMVRYYVTSVNKHGLAGFGIPLRRVFNIYGEVQKEVQQTLSQVTKSC